MTVHNVSTPVILAVRKVPKENDAALTARIEELRGLCEAAGARVLTQFVQEKPDIDASLYLGSGKVHEIAQAVGDLECELVVFDGELSPAQLRNLEAALDCRVIDRTQLILDIFALRARSREGRLQVEIAQLQYLLPRLTGRGVEMSRLGGGIGTRGPGETKLEVDRRRIRRRMAQLREQLKDVKRSRGIQREKRGRTVPVVALVGYTNAGKTTLMQCWTETRGSAADVRGHNRLFDTLDPLARRVKAGTTGELVLLDTVGFVQNLPHLLVDAFRATLEEVVAADVIVHVVDASADPTTHLQTTYQVLTEIGAVDKPIVTFFNKLDAATNAPGPDTRAQVTVFGSAVTGEGVEQLYQEVERLVEMDPVHMVIQGPVDSADFWSDVAKVGRVIETGPVSGDTVQLTLEVERRTARAYRDRYSKRGNYEQ